jgi:hypothetical protein
MAWLAAVAGPLLLAAGWWPSIDARTVLVGLSDTRGPSLDRLFQSLNAHFSPNDALKVYKDGVGTTLTVLVRGRSIGLQSNGLPQSGREMDPPHYNLESSLVGLYPAMHRPDGRNALVIGLGTGITVGVLRKAGIPEVEVVELEPALASICRGIYPAGASPLDDSGVTLRLDDARNFLVRNGYSGSPRKWDIIASQPAHPWVSGAADLFTEEMFRLAYSNLSEGGVFCQWFMETGIDADSYAALANAFGRVFDQAILYRAYGDAHGLYFIGTKGRPALSLPDAENLFRRPALRQLLELNGISEPAGIYRFAVTPLGEGAGFLTPGRPVNRDRNAYVEARIPLLPKAASLPLDGLGDGRFTGPLPAGFRAAGPRETLFVFDAIDRMSGNFPAGQPLLEADSLRAARIGVYHRNAPPPFREYHAVHLGLALGNMGPEEIDRAVAEAERIGYSLLAHQLRYLRLRKWAAPPGPPLPAGFDSLPEDFRGRVRSQAVLALAESGRYMEAEGLITGGPVDPAFSAMARLLWARSSEAGGDPAGMPDIDEDGLAAAYRRCLLEWKEKDLYLEALESHCLRIGDLRRAEMARRARAEKQDRELERLTSEGMRLKEAGHHDAALKILARVTERNPSLLNPYVARAEIHGKRRNRAGLDSLATAVRRTIPSPDVYLQRIQDAYDLVSADSIGRVIPAN